MSNQHQPPMPRSGPVETLATVTELTRPGSGREPVPVASVQGTLALDLGLAGLPAEPRTPELRMVPGDGTPEHHGLQDLQRLQDLPDLKGLKELQIWAARFAQATVEVLGGDRPLPQLLRWTSARVYADLDRRVRILGRAAPAPQRLRTVRPQVRSVHVCRPAPAIAEVSVHVRHGHRSRALAARLEHRQGRWLCVALQLG
jgi:Family of unknown function (DUF6459)